MFQSFPEPSSDQRGSLSLDPHRNRKDALFPASLGKCLPVFHCLIAWTAIPELKTVTLENDCCLDRKESRLTLKVGMVSVRMAENRKGYLILKKRPGCCFQREKEWMPNKYQPYYAGFCLCQASLIIGSSHFLFPKLCVPRCPNWCLWVLALLFVLKVLFMEYISSCNKKKITTGC